MTKYYFSHFTMKQPFLTQTWVMSNQHSSKFNSYSLNYKNVLGYDQDSRMVSPPGSSLFSHHTYFLLSDADGQTHSVVSDVSDSSPLMRIGDEANTCYVKLWKYLCSCCVFQCFKNTYFYKYLKLSLC